MAVLRGRVAVAGAHLNNQCFPREKLKLSIIIPTFNEQDNIGLLLDTLCHLREAGHEIIVADGGSRDDTVKIAMLHNVPVVISEPGRARQMNAGAAKAGGNVLLFLHADTHLPGNFLLLMRSFWVSYAVWGRFDVRLSGDHPMLRIVEFMMNWRSRVTGIATGDQAIFIKTSIFQLLGGFPDQPLMEDIAISTYLRKLTRPFCLSYPLVTSSRRWEKHGVFRTIWLMWKLRYQYYRGLPAEEIARQYRRNDS